MNSTHCRSIGCTPYEMVFNRKPYFDRVPLHLSAEQSTQLETGVIIEDTDQVAATQEFVSRFDLPSVTDDEEARLEAEFRHRRRTLDEADTQLLQEEARENFHNESIEARDQRRLQEAEDEALARTLQQIAANSSDDSEHIGLKDFEEFDFAGEDYGALFGEHAESSASRQDQRTDSPQTTQQTEFADAGSAARPQQDIPAENAGAVGDAEESTSAPKQVHKPQSESHQNEGTNPGSSAQSQHSIPAENAENAENADAAGSAEGVLIDNAPNPPTTPTHPQNDTTIDGELLSPSMRRLQLADESSRANALAELEGTPTTQYRVNSVVHAERARERSKKQYGKQRQVQVFEVGDQVSVAIPAEVRTTTDDKRVLGKVINVFEELNQYQIITRHGVLDRNWPVDKLNLLPADIDIELPDPPPSNIVTMSHVATQQNTSQRVAVKCNCKDRKKWCKTRTCACIKHNQKCTIYCHNGDGHPDLRDPCPNASDPQDFTSRGLRPLQEQQEGNKRQRKDAAGRWIATRGIGMGPVDDEGNLMKAGKSKKVQKKVQKKK